MTSIQIQLLEYFNFRCKIQLDLTAENSFQVNSTSRCRWPLDDPDPGSHRKPTNPLMRPSSSRSLGKGTDAAVNKSVAAAPHLWSNLR